MRMIIFILLAMVMIFSGCASRDERLAQEYELVSKKMDGMQSEAKMSVNAQNAVDDYIKAKEEVNKRIEKLMQIRAENEDNDIPIGLSIDQNADPEELANQLRMNFDHLSKKLDELREEKGRIATEQMGVDD